ncbi:coagulation factor V-like [Actinia tenebrosa]|uniref:Coagulation factor V-like n=1 Tax=Actinia tenebrosa TaxID=6105 RepID=A0A6P8IBJ6_ACTTE|nr:coagulation factor V-like [Actinia tenebrosa]
MENISMWIRLVCLHALVISTTIKETIGSNGGCYSALGMESGDITDGQITASSFMIAPPSVARLNKKRHILGAWCASYNDNNPHLQVDFLDVKNITAFSSQGVEFTGDHWVSLYTVSYSCDGRTWQKYWNGSTIKTFTANTDTDSVVLNYLPKPIIARMIRIHPVAWYRWGSICMRVEVHGCKSDQVCSTPTTPTPNATTTTTVRRPPTERTSKPSTTVSTPTIRSTTRTTAGTTVKTEPPCTSALGMENYQIKNHQITASSAKSIWTSPSAARLNNRLKMSSFGSWCASATDSSQYLQVDFKTHQTIVAIATQGMAFPDGNWVTSYTLSYSCNGTTWFVYGENGKRKTFVGNRDSNQIVKHYLATPLITRLVRLNPVTWNKFGEICLRMELYGCNASQGCTVGNISAQVRPATTRRPRRSRTTEHVPDILHEPARRTKPTTHSTKQPTETHPTTKKKKRILIIYKKIEDDDSKSSARRETLDWTMVLPLLSSLVFR